jgi:carboxymethylenebutenolidase
MVGLRARWLLLALAIAASSTGAQQAAKIHMHLDDGYAADGLLFEPNGTQATAAVLLIHDEWGLTSGVIDEARDLAASGYLVVAIDLYRGRIAADAKQAALLSRELSRDRALHDLKASIAFIHEQPNVRAGHIGVVAWSSGGAYALRLAAVEPDLAAVVMNGSAPAADPSQLKGFKATVLANFGGRDPAVSPKAVAAFERTLRSQGVMVQTQVYPQAGHDFQRADLAGFRSEDAREAQARTREFLKAELNRSDDF